MNDVSLYATWDHIKRTVPTSAINSCKLWPAVTAFSFTFINAQYRSIFAGVIAIGWQTYLSYLNRTAEEVELETRKLKVVELVPVMKESKLLESEDTMRARKAKDTKDTIDA